MLKIPISGGPHTGKTTLLGALREAFPEAHFVEEPAEKVITEELRLTEETQDYAGIFPWNDYPLFVPKVLEASAQLESAIPDGVEVVFQDRSIIDNIGYYKLNGHSELLPEIERRIQAANYAFAFFCEPVGTYTPTVIRRETPEEAALTHQFLAEAYDQSDIHVIHLPAVSVPERVELINQVIREHI